MPEKEQLEHAIAAIRRGETTQGRQILVGILKTNPKNELAWLWLVRSLPNDDQRITALEQCLKVNPNSETARRTLEQLQTNRSTDASLSTTSSSLTPEPLPGRKEASLQAAHPTPLGDRLAKVEMPVSQDALPASPDANTPPASAESSRPVAVRRYRTSSQTVRQPKPRFSILFFFQLLLGIILLSLITFLGWIALVAVPGKQDNLAQTAMFSTAVALETQNFVLEQQVSQRQTQSASQPTSTPIPTYTPQPSVTITPTSTPLPTRSGIVSRVNPDNIITLAKSIALPGSSFTSVEFSPDNSLLAASSAQGITLWDASSLEQVRQIYMEKTAVDVAFAPDGSAFFFSQVGDANTSYLFAAATADNTNLLPGVELPGETLRLFVSPDGSTVVRVSSAATGNINLVNPENTDLLATLDHPGALLAASLNPFNGFLAVSGLSDNQIQVWDLENQQVKTVLTAQAAPVTALKFSPDGSLLASASDDGVIQIWNTENWKLSQTLTGHDQPVQSLVFTPDHRLLLCADAQDRVTVWDTAASKQLSAFVGPSGLQEMAFSMDGAKLALAGTQSLEIWVLPAP